MINFGAPHLAAIAALLLLHACAGKKKSNPEEEKTGSSEHKAGKVDPADDAVPVKATPDDLGYGDDARLFDSPADAMRAIMEVKPQIIGFGEYHKLATSANVQSALRRFADEMLDVVGPGTDHLVLETWSVDPSCGKKGKAVTKKVEETIQRPKETENEMQTLMRKSQEHGIRGSVLQFSCEEYNALLNTDKKAAGGKGALNAEALLEVVSRKLGESALAAWKTKKNDKMVLVYGGATHNNLTPYAGLEAWSYAQKLAKESEARFVEVDLYVPELVQSDAVLSQEAWYPLLKETRKDQVILIRRDETSYIILMRKDYAEPGAEAKKPADSGAESGDGKNDGEQSDKENNAASQDGRAPNP